MVTEEDERVLRGSWIDKRISDVTTDSEADIGFFVKNT